MDQYALVFTLSGRARYRDELGADLFLHPGDMLCVLPGISHIYGPPHGELWSEFYLVFNGPIFDLWRDTGLLNAEDPVVHLGDVATWLPQLQSVCSPSGLPGTRQTLQETCRLQTLMSQIFACRKKAGDVQPLPSTLTTKIEHACALLAADRAQALSLPRLAQRLGLTYETFRKQFALVMGLPPSKYRAARLIDQACQLMRDRNHSDKHIALHLGFCDEFHFSRRFKQIVGCSPRTFRQRASVACQP